MKNTNKIGLGLLMVVIGGMLVIERPVYGMQKELLDLRKSSGVLSSAVNLVLNNPLKSLGVTLAVGAGAGLYWTVVRRKTDKLFDKTNEIVIKGEINVTDGMKKNLGNLDICDDAGKFSVKVCENEGQIQRNINTVLEGFDATLREMNNKKTLSDKMIMNGFQELKMLESRRQGFWELFLKKFGIQWKK
jgi:hypothetical protein